MLAYFGANFVSDVLITLGLDFSSSTLNPDAASRDQAVIIIGQQLVF